MREGLARRGPGWRAWIAVLAIALVGAASTAAAWHEEQAGDQDCQDCVVCQLRHQTADETSGSLPVEPADAPRPFEQQPPAGRVETDHFRRLPARGPPA